MEKGGCVYILASGKHGTLYIGVTSRLKQRLYEHRERLTGGFTAEYGVDHLVWYEDHSLIEAAIGREKRMKKWRREWKINLIETDNPHWEDLAVPLFGFEPMPEPSRHPREGGDP